VQTTVILYVLSTLVAFLTAAAITPLIAHLAERFEMLDMPGGRRQHPWPIPRPGGLAIALAFGLTIFTFWAIDRYMGRPFLIPEEVRTPRFALTALAAFLGMTVGFIDDAFDLRARWQFLGNAIVAFIVIAAGIHIDFIDDPLGSGLIELAFPVAVAFTFFWIVGMNVALNFIDGLDGLAAGVAAIAAATLGAIALLPQVSEPFVAWMAFSLAGASVGFLLFNFHPARLFMGTSGVVFVGTMLAVLSIFGTAKVAAALLVLGVPIIDTFYVLMRRVLQRQPPFAPDRGHLHHRLLDIGLSHAQAVLLIYAVTLGFGAIALLTNGRTQALAFGGAVVVFGLVVIALARAPKPEPVEAPAYAEEGDTV
jgi:UDP-GlcNAc:undecaprenyl-phosphate GlcNAc-1-phosphate transferase